MCWAQAAARRALAFIDRWPSLCLFSTLAMIQKRIEELRRDYFPHDSPPGRTSEALSARISCDVAHNADNDKGISSSFGPSEDPESRKPLSMGRDKGHLLYLHYFPGDFISPEMSFSHPAQGKLLPLRRKPLTTQGSASYTPLGGPDSLTGPVSSGCLWTPEASRPTSSANLRPFSQTTMSTRPGSEEEGGLGTSPSNIVQHQSSD